MCKLLLGMQTENVKYENGLVETEDDYLKARTGTYQCVPFYLLKGWRELAMWCLLVLENQALPPQTFDRLFGLCPACSAPLLGDSL